MTKCQICGHENPEGTEYCEDCGASLSVSGAGGTGTAAPATPATPDGSAPPVVAASPAAAGTAATGASPEGVAPPVPMGTGAPAASAPAAPDAPVPAPDEGFRIPITPASETDAGTTARIPVNAAPDAAGSPASPAAPASTGSAAPTPATGGGGASQGGTNPRMVAQRYGAATGDEFPLLGERLIVGRFDAETGPVDIDLSSVPESAHLSRHHAELYREADGRWHVKDLGSTNGVFVKSPGSATFGPRLTEPRALTSGDEVAFGNARFIFRAD